MVALPDSPAQFTVPRSAAMADVAALAGVSSQTVSRVANGASNVKESTRRKVIDAMRQVGYRPNGAARALKRGSFQSVGVITFTLGSYGNVRTIDALSRRLAEHGYSVTLIQLAERSLGSISGAYNRLADEAVDAVAVLFEARLIDRVEADFPPGLPVVVIDSTSETSRFSTVDTDQAQGARIATEYLIGLGHREIWHLAGPEGSFSAGLREYSWGLTMTEHGLRPGQVLRGDWSALSGYDAGQVIARNPRVSAVFAANDSMAFGLLRAFHEKGIRVPEDISVIGFDDMPDASCAWPPLSTVAQDFEKVGDIFMELLDHQINQRDEEIEHRRVPTELVIRESTGPASIERLALL